MLVSTTIIETGLDISNANTMIIHDADRLGLSQMYQLRGACGKIQSDGVCISPVPKRQAAKGSGGKKTGGNPGVYRSWFWI